MAKKKTKKRKRSINQRDKGARGQREVCKMLEAWWGSEFTSTPQSGGFATKQFRDEWNAAADIVTPDETFPFSVEVKWQESWCMDMLISSEKSKLWSWWKQCYTETPEGKIPLLVFHRNRQPWWYMIPVKDRRPIRDENIGRVFLVDVPHALVTEIECDRTVQVGLMDDLAKTSKAKWLQLMEIRSRAK